MLSFYKDKDFLAIWIEACVRPKIGWRNYENWDRQLSPNRKNGDYPIPKNLKSRFKPISPLYPPFFTLENLYLCAITINRMYILIFRTIIRLFSAYCGGDGQEYIRSTRSLCRFPDLPRRAAFAERREWTAHWDLYGPVVRSEFGILGDSFLESPVKRSDQDHKDQEEDNNNNPHPLND